MKTIIAFATAALAALSLNLAYAQGDDYDPDPNRLPGPKHFNPESCKQYPEVCRAREEAIRRQYQDCLDKGGDNCVAPASKKPKRKAAPKPTD